MGNDETAHADNWRTVLVVDAAMGLAALGAGVWLGLGRSLLLGLVVGAAGAAYIAAVAARARRWQQIRREAGR